MFVLHHHKKFLVLAGFGLAMTALGLCFFAKTKKEEKKHWCCHF
jgi:hypothetical protein